MSQNDRKMTVNLREVYRLAEQEYEVPADVKAAARGQVEALDRDLAAIDGEAPGRAALTAR